MTETPWKTEKRVMMCKLTDRVIIRSRDSGVHWGILKSRTGAEVELADARRIWSWSGAATLSELATAGVTRPADCKFSVRVPAITIIGVCEVIPCTERACEIIDEVPEWTMQ